MLDIEPIPASHTEFWKKIYLDQARDFRAFSLGKLLMSYPLGKSVIDIGCGSGYFSALLARQGHDVTALEPSPDMASMARDYFFREHLSTIRLLESPIESVISNDTSDFDSLICLDVLEHIENDYQAYGDLIALLRQHGTAVISVPALPFLYGPKDSAIGHYRRYSRTCLSTLIMSQSIKVLDLRYWNFVGVPITFFVGKILKRRVNEDFRNSEAARYKRYVNSLLTQWMTRVENNVRFPIGLSLVAYVQKL